MALNSFAVNFFASFSFAGDSFVLNSFELNSFAVNSFVGDSFACYGGYGNFFWRCWISISPPSPAVDSFFAVDWLFVHSCLNV